MERPSAGIGEGVEVERYGRGIWSRIVFMEDGNGVGVADSAIDVSVQREYCIHSVLITKKIEDISLRWPQIVDQGNHYATCQDYNTGCDRHGWVGGYLHIG